MADIAGLIVGGVAIASLFTTCIDCFEFVQLGKRFGGDYQKYLLRLRIVQLRLSRWGESVRIAAERRESVTNISDQDAIAVKILLGQIMESFDEAKKFDSESERDTFGLSVDQNDNVFSVASKIRALALRRQKGTRLMKKMRWALYEEKQLDKIIGDITRFVNDLVELFPAATAAQQRLCVDEVEEIIDARNDERGLVVLKTASVDIDEMMSSVAGNAIDAIHGHSYINVNATDRARVMNGDQINEGTYAAGSYHSYRDISGSGNARILNGNTFGGRSFWDD